LKKDKTLQRIRRALESDDFETAGLLAEMAISKGKAHEMLYRIAIMRRQRTGDFHGAVAFHLDAVRLSPFNAEILTSAADALREVGQLTASLLLFDRALIQVPTLVAAWYGRALALEATGALEDARSSYRKVMEFAPNTAPGFAGYAMISAQLGYAGDARRYAMRAHNLAPKSPAANMALARCEMADHNNQRAVDILQSIIGGTGIGAQDEVALLTLLGDALDGNDNVADAFIAYSTANARFAKVNAISDMPSFLLARINEIEEALSMFVPNTWISSQDREDSPVTQHIFLLGYPRSGTTLIEQALASLPDVVTLEETPTLDDAEHLLTAQGMVALAKLSENEICDLRKAYWTAVEVAGVDVSGQTFVDMDPSKSIALPLIARLFPKAKVVIMRRDPRDIVWSCFRRAFIKNALTEEFTSLHRTARHYDAIMRLTSRCLEVLPIDAHAVVYEDLVQDFDAVTRDLCAFVGLPWSPNIHNFGSTARLGRVKTASAVQVRGPLFDGSGQWKRYMDKLEPILPILEPWILSQPNV
jgi:tetratricopeptide (TPR) repeat protein